MPESEEHAYREGSRRQLIDIVQFYLQKLGVDDVDWGWAMWVIERQEAIAKLRELCGAYGDTDFADDDSIADILDKHLQPYLEACCDPDEP